MIPLDKMRRWFQIAFLADHLLEHHDLKRKEMMRLVQLRSTKSHLECQPFDQSHNSTKNRNTFIYR
jgi:hypothetical protein